MNANRVSVVALMICLFMSPELYAQTKGGGNQEKEQAQDALNNAAIKYAEAASLYNAAKDLQVSVEAYYVEVRDLYLSKAGGMAEEQKNYVAGQLGSAAGKKFSASTYLDTANAFKQQAWTNYCNAANSFDLGWYDLCITFSGYCVADCAACISLGVEPADSKLWEAVGILEPLNIYLLLL